MGHTLLLLVFLSFGKPAPGFTLADSQENIGDHIARVVTCKSGSSVAALARKAARLRFVMKDADLYLIRFPK